jgi:hypothetical protein
MIYSVGSMEQVVYDPEVCYCAFHNLTHVSWWTPNDMCSPVYFIGEECLSFPFIAAEPLYYTTVESKPTATTYGHRFLTLRKVILLQGRVDFPGTDTKSYCNCYKYLQELAHPRSDIGSRQAAKIYYALRTQMRKRFLCPGSGERMLDDFWGYTCEEEGEELCLWDMIQHLNDGHKWTRERIADWVEGLDMDLQLPVPEEVSGN